jgi:hypothetical protein
MSGENSDTGLTGKKIFFLYPSALIQNEILAELAQQEFEVYTVKNYVPMRGVLKRYPDSIVFVNIDAGMSEGEWETWIRGVMGDPALKEVKVGIISANKDENLQQKYLNTFKLPCGYTILKPDPSILIKQLLEILQAADAKGRRKYLRATSDSDQTTVNFPLGSAFINGLLKDISTVGFSCAFDKDPEFAKNALFQNVQIKLQSQLLKVEGIVFGSRMDGTSKTYVVLFTQRIDPEVRTRIRKYIQINFQARMDLELK